MPTYHYALEEKGDCVITVTWVDKLQNIVVRYEGQTIATFATIDHVHHGQSFMVPDDSRLELQVHMVGKAKALRLLRDGKKLVWLDKSRIQTVSLAGSILLVFGGVGVLIGPMMLFSGLSAGDQFLIYTGTFGIFFGVIALICAYYMWRHYVTVTALVAIVLVGVLCAAIGFSSSSPLEALGAMLLPFSLTFLLFSWAHRDLKALNKV
jgi:hypothetical protein